MRRGDSWLPSQSADATPDDFRESLRRVEADPDAYTDAQRRDLQAEARLVLGEQ